MKVEWEGAHPDEGSIHAWLDGELDASEATLLDEHVRGCTECGARVAEARGLMAGASRVIGQLDAAPGRLIQPATTPTLDDTGSMWRLMRVTPARASIAAVLLVALGITLTRTRVAKDSEVAQSVATAPASTEAPMTAMAEPKEASAPLPPKDEVLNSAIARKLANEHPARTVERAPGPDMPKADSLVAATDLPDLSAPQRVAAGRISLRSSRDTSSPPADKARAGFNVRSAVAADQMSTAGAAAEAAGVRNELSGKVAGIVLVPPTASQCYLVESSAPGAQWGSVTLPMVVAFDSTGVTARVLTTGGTDTEMRAVRVAGAPDSLVLRMRRIGYNGTLAVSGTGDARTGEMRSSAATNQLSEVVTTGSSGRADLRGRTAQSDARNAPQPAAAPPAVAKKVETPVRESERSAGVATAITAHVVSCTKR